MTNGIRDQLGMEDVAKLRRAEIMSNEGLMRDLREAFREWASGEKPTPRAELKRK